MATLYVSTSDGTTLAAESLADLAAQLSQLGFIGVHLRAVDEAGWTHGWVGTVWDGEELQSYWRAA